MFSVYAELLQLHERGGGLVALLSGAAYRLRNMDEVSLLPAAELSKLFRPQIIELFDELKLAGNIEALDELIQLTPSGLFEMMRIRGLGGKKLSVLWRVAKIDNIDKLLEACKKNELSKLPGFGRKTEENIINAIESYRSNQDRFHYASVSELADQLVSILQKALHTKLISLCGEVRRQTTTVASIEILAAVEAKKFVVKEIRRFLMIQSSTSTETRAHTLDEVPVIIYHTSTANFYSDLFSKTGNEDHVKKILNTITVKRSSSEEEIYEKANLPFIPAELRENLAEWSMDKKRIAQLITPDDIKGVVHNHTNWSDGVDRLENFVQACIKRKFEYVVISDHSKNAHYAGGMKEGKVLRQMEAIDTLNKKLKGFKVFKSIECDILVSGELDYSHDLLKQFDLVIASVHQLLKMDKERATKRLIRAIENPYTTILGHMTGRQLLIRPGYPVDFEKVIDACAANGVIIEINANPYRLDMDWSHIPYAIKKGVMISINPDSHSIGEIENIRWGVSAARKGGLTKDMTWNAMSLSKVENWLASRRARIQRSSTRSKTSRSKQLI